MLLGPHGKVHCSGCRKTFSVNVDAETFFRVVHFGSTVCLIFSPCFSPCTLAASRGRFYFFPPSSTRTIRATLTLVMVSTRLAETWLQLSAAVHCGQCRYRCRLVIIVAQGNSPAVWVHQHHRFIGHCRRCCSVAPFDSNFSAGCWTEMSRWCKCFPLAHFYITWHHVD